MIGEDERWLRITGESRSFIRVASGFHQTVNIKLTTLKASRQKHVTTSINESIIVEKR